MRHNRQQTDAKHDDRREATHLGRDDRAIEGLPIRLIIAIIVGVAALAVMMTMLDGLDYFNDEELSIEFHGDSVIEEGEVVEVTVVDENGNAVEGATVLVNEGTARIEGDQTETTNADGEVSIAADPQLPQGQNQGTLTFDIQPPHDSSYTGGDDLEEMLVIPSS